MVTLSLFCSSPFPGSSGPGEPSLKPQKGNGDVPLSPQYTFSSLGSVDPSCQSGLYTHCPQTSPASAASTQPVPQLLPQVHALFSFAQILAFISQSTPNLTSFVTLLQYQPSWRWVSLFHILQCFGLGIHSLPGTICYHVNRHSNTDVFIFHKRI